jgi:hypothetical protein
VQDLIVKEQTVATVAATAVAAVVNYDTLEADVAAWVEDYARWIGEQQGEEAGRDMLADLTANPKRALRWYVEDHMRDDEETVQ